MTAHNLPNFMWITANASASRRHSEPVTIYAIPKKLFLAPMKLVVDNMPNPISQEFELMLSQNALGVNLEEVLNDLAKRIPYPDVQMFVTSVNILKETGGNLAETFDTIVRTIRERIKVENNLACIIGLSHRVQSMIRNHI